MPEPSSSNTSRADSTDQPRSRLHAWLDELVVRFEHADYIASDPISIPHAFDDPRDQEIVGLFAAILAWGRRDTVLRKMEDLCERMAYRPFRFVWDFPSSRQSHAISDFRHRTFQPIDALWLTNNLSIVLRRHGSIERVFADAIHRASDNVGVGIEAFSAAVLAASSETPARLRKHLARPGTGSACKRLCMYARWMTRPGPFDLGIWTRVEPSQLMLPLDVHSGRQARRLGMLQRKSNDWKSVSLLTDRCREFSSDDPSRYDLALFGMGAHGVEPDPSLIAQANVA